MKRVWVVVIVTACLLPLIGSPSSAADLSEILKAGRKVQVEEVAPLRIESNEALAGVYARIQRQMQFVSGIKSLDKQSPDTRRREIQRLKARLAVLEQLETVASGDTDSQAEALKKAEQKIVELQKQRAKVDAPIQQKFRELFRKYADRHTELAAAMANFFQENGKGELDGLTRKGISGQFHECSAYTVYYQAGRPACQISVKYLPDRTDVTAIEKIADGIELLSLNDRNASLRVGQLQVSFYTQQPDGWNKDRIKLAVKQLVNLEGLAKIKLD